MSKFLERELLRHEVCRYCQKSNQFLCVIFEGKKEIIICQKCMFICKIKTKKQEGNQSNNEEEGKK